MPRRFRPHAPPGPVALSASPCPCPGRWSHDPASPTLALHPNGGGVRRAPTDTPAARKEKNVDRTLPGEHGGWRR